LNCEYGNDYWTLWPTYQYCSVFHRDFPSTAKNERFRITGSTEDKNNTTVVYFDSSPSIDFIPLEIFTEFPNINGIIISDSNIPILKEGFFTKDFQDIQYLNLGSNKIN
jgi:hypothetical protein